MFKISIDFLDQPPPRASYSRMTIDEIYGYLPWEANLSIIYNNQVFFSEQVAVAEFYWYMFNWFRKYLAGKKEQFIYSSVEHTEPILVFSNIQNGYWSIDSIWKQYSGAALIEDQLLFSEINNLMNKLTLAMEQQ